MTQYEQENDFGRGGGEVDDETYEQAWANREARIQRDPEEAGGGAEPDRGEKQA